MFLFFVFLDEADDIVKVAGRRWLRLAKDRYLLLVRLTFEKKYICVLITVRHYSSPDIKSNNVGN